MAIFTSAFPLSFPVIAFYDKHFRNTLKKSILCKKVEFFESFQMPEMEEDDVTHFMKALVGQQGSRIKISDYSRTIHSSQQDHSFQVEASKSVQFLDKVWSSISSFLENLYDILICLLYLFQTKRNTFRSHKKCICSSSIV